MAAPAKGPAPAGPAKKTAVMVVHGMGEQRPMETMWGLVAALWTADPDIKVTRPGTPDIKEVWSKPEGLAHR